MKVRLTTKLMIMYMLLLMSIVIGVGGYYVAGNLGRIRDESISTTSQFADRIMEQVDLRLKNMDQMAVDLFSDSEFRQAAQQWADGSAADVETSIRQILNRHYASKSDTRRSVLHPAPEGGHGSGRRGSIKQEESEWNVMHGRPRCCRASWRSISTATIPSGRR